MANLEATKTFHLPPPITPTANITINTRKPLPQILPRTPLKTETAQPAKMPVKRRRRGTTKPTKPTKPTTPRTRSCHTCRAGHNKCVAQGPGLPCVKCVRRRLGESCSLIDTAGKGSQSVKTTPVPPSTPPQTPGQSTRAVAIADLIEAPCCTPTNTSAISPSTTLFVPQMEGPPFQGYEGNYNLQTIAAAALGYLSMMDDMTYEKRQEQVSPSPREARPAVAAHPFDEDDIYD